MPTKAPLRSRYHQAWYRCLDGAPVFGGQITLTNSATGAIVRLPPLPVAWRMGRVVIEYVAAGGIPAQWDGYPTSEVFLVRGVYVPMMVRVHFWPRYARLRTVRPRHRCPECHSRSLRRVAVWEVLDGEDEEGEDLLCRDCGARRSWVTGEWEKS